MPVYFQTASLEESLTTCITRKGFKTSVNMLVYFQTASLEESLAENVTHKGFKTSVNMLVYFKLLAWRRKPYHTYHT